jgi:uncharacterized protein
MNCPNCNISLLLSDRQGIEIDYCPKCRGVWLDRNELDKIIERSVGIQDQSYHNPHNHMNDNHDPRQNGFNRHRKKGWLDELFD